MEFVSTDQAPRPAGHYSQGVVHCGIVYVSGQLPIDPETGERVTGSIEDQADRAIRNLAGVLEAAGSGMDRVLKTTVYVSDIALWSRVNEVYARHFGEHKPARAVVPTRELHFGFQIEIEAVAYIGEGP